MLYGSGLTESLYTILASTLPVVQAHGSQPNYFACGNTVLFILVAYVGFAKMIILALNSASSSWSLVVSSHVSSTRSNFIRCPSPSMLISINPHEQEMATSFRSASYHLLIGFVFEAASWAAYCLSDLILLSFLPQEFDREFDGELAGRDMPRPLPKP